MKNWPHAPAHRIGETGAYIVTAGTYLKQHFFSSPARLSLLQDNLLALADQYRWQLQAWSVFSNHYHLIAIALEGCSSLSKFIGHLHTVTAIAINKEDATPGRKVWFQYWDTHLTYEKSYLARLNYVHQNPVKHGVVQIATRYPWCSADWFEREADSAFVKTVSSFGSDRLVVEDDYSVECGGLTPPL